MIKHYAIKFLIDTNTVTSFKCSDLIRQY